MSNWFEQNPTKSVIGYTIIITAATWAASTFILQDNRINLAKSELESQKGLTETYKSKVDLLQKELDIVRSDNAEYRAWLSQAKDAVPIMVTKLSELKAQLAIAEAESAQARAKNSERPETQLSLPTNKLVIARRGSAFIEESTGFVFAVLEVKLDRTANVSIKLPDQNKISQITVVPGSSWDFNDKQYSYKIIVESISFVTDEVSLRIITRDI